MNRAAAVASLLVLSCAAPVRAADPPPRHLVVALVSLKSLYTDGSDATVNKGHLEANLKRHLEFADRAAAKGAGFIGFPGMSLSG